MTLVACVGLVCFTWLATVAIYTRNKTGKSAAVHAAACEKVAASAHEAVKTLAHRVSKLEARVFD
jgi:hypothetical protein